MRQRARLFHRELFFALPGLICILRGTGWFAGWLLVGRLLVSSLKRPTSSRRCVDICARLLAAFANRWHRARCFAPLAPALNVLRHFARALGGFRDIAGHLVGSGGLLFNGCGNRAGNTVDLANHTADRTDCGHGALGVGLDGFILRLMSSVALPRSAWPVLSLRWLRPRIRRRLRPHARLPPWRSVPASPFFGRSR